MPDSLTEFESFLPVRDQLYIEHGRENWRTHAPIVSSKSKRTCAEIARELEENEQKADARRDAWKLKRNLNKPKPFIRYDVLKRCGFKCCACGSKDNLHIDHIKPFSKYPELASDFDNLQVLCISCNASKRDRHEDDLRPDAPKSTRTGRNASKTGCPSEKVLQLDLF